MHGPSLYIGVLLFLLTGCIGPSTHPALQDAGLPDLIAADTFFANDEDSGMHTISPDGSKLAWLAKKDDFFTLFFKKRAGGKATAVNIDCWCSVDSYTWAEDSRHILFSLSAPGNHLYRADSENPSTTPVDLTPDTKWGFRDLHKISSQPDTILISLNQRCRACFDLYTLNILTGEKELVAESDKDVMSWIISPSGTVIGRKRVSSENEISLELFEPKDNSWRLFQSWPFGDDVQIYGVSKDENSLWLLSNRNRDLTALVRLDLTTGEEQVLDEAPGADIESVFLGPGNYEPLFTAAFPDYPRLHAIEPDMATGLASLSQDKSTGLNVLSMDASRQLWTVKIFDEKGADYYLYDRNTETKTLLGSNRLPLSQESLVETRPVNLQSQDGMTLHGYLTTPTGVNGAPLPMVLLVHGGPWARDYWSYDSMVQFLANRGYLVLQINYRGSTGYGRSYQEAAKGEFAGKMHTDLIDAVRWAIDQRLADPDRVAIVGSSYGGYASLAGLTFTPEVFSCGIAINGVADWFAFLESFHSTIIPPYRQPAYSNWATYLGDPGRPGSKEEVDKVSPIYFADRVQRPLLIVRGGQDTIVPPQQSSRMYGALRKLQKEVEFLDLPAEGHSFGQLSSVLALYEKIEQFLARHLGGRYDG